MKKKSITPDLLSYKAFFTFLFMMGTGVPPAFSQSSMPDNKRGTWYNGFLCEYLPTFIRLNYFMNTSRQQVKSVSELLLQ